jgi:hypothetical protein
MSRSIAPGVAKLVGNASVWKLTQSLGCDRRAGDIARQSFKPRSVVSVYRDTCVKAEALHAGTAFSRDKLDILGFDSIPESHHGFARAGTCRNSLVQRGCDACGEERLFVLQRVLGCCAVIREQAATLEQADDAPGAAAATRAISSSSGAGRGKNSGVPVLSGSA